MTLVELVDRFESVERSIAIVNRTEPEPIRRMLVDTFGDDAVDVTERTATADAGGDAPRVETLVDEGDGIGVVESDGTDGGPAIDLDSIPDDAFEGETLADAEDLVLLVEDRSVVATSSLEELVNAILLVNSDLYITGSRGIEELDLPAVLTGLEDTVFSLQGYPESNRQKLLLITISRFIERAAHDAGRGTIRSSFQRLSRLNDEVGTREVYEQLLDDGVDAHLYGVPDEIPDDMGAVIHAGDSVDFTDTWFVVYRPPGGPSRSTAADDLRRGVEGGVALLAAEVERRVWRGVWTFDSERIRRINGYIERNL